MAERRSAAPTAIAPFFVVGCPRSGTTLLQRILDAHGELAITPETHFVRRFWLRRLSYGALHRDANYRRLIDDVVSIPEFSDMGLDATTFREHAWDGKRSYARLFDLLLRQFASARGVDRVGEKTPSHARFIGTLARFFPGAKFVHIVRDPRAVVSSWRNVPWSTGLPGADAEVWRRHVAAVRLSASTRAAAIHTLSYEHLVAHPEASLRDLCSFLEIAFDPRMLRFHERDLGPLDLDREPWKAGAAKPLDTAPIDRWRNELSAASIAQIEAVTWFEMKRCGYEPESPIWAAAPSRLALSPVLAAMRLRERVRQVMA